MHIWEFMKQLCMQTYTAECFSNDFAHTHLAPPLSSAAGLNAVGGDEVAG